MINFTNFPSPLSQVPFFVDNSNRLQYCERLNSKIHVCLKLTTCWQEELTIFLEVGSRLLFSVSVSASASASVLEPLVFVVWMMSYLIRITINGNIFSFLLENLYVFRVCNTPMSHLQNIDQNRDHAYCCLFVYFDHHQRTVNHLFQTQRYFRFYILNPIGAFYFDPLVIT